jgi:hypothetical protein
LVAAVSCPSPSFCAAFDVFGQAVTWDGKQWSAPSLADGASGNVTGLSCASTTSCLMVDQGGNSFPATATQYALVTHETALRVAVLTGSAACSDHLTPSQMKAAPPMDSAMQNPSRAQETSSKLAARPSCTRRDHREPSQVTPWPHISTAAQDRAVEQESE